MLTIQGRVSQKLEERSQIRFEFPDGSVRVLPFFDNIDISESKKANYIRYQPLGRSSTIFNYVGSEARQLSLSFNLMLPLIYELVNKDLVLITFPYDSRNHGSLTKESFLRTGGDQEGAYQYRIKNGDAKEFDINYINLLTSEYLNSAALNVLDPSFGTVPSLPTSKNTLHKKVVDIIVYWVNLVRASVVNNSSNITMGPPVVRLTHGIMYQEVPCLCMGYKIEKEEMAGYDNATLLPRLLKISMDLVELRHGDFSKYEANTPIKRDNIIGWEAIIQGEGKHSVSMDPLPIRSR